LLAAIDNRSNSFRLELGQLDAARYRRVDYLKETVRLGAGLDENGLLIHALYNVKATGHVASLKVKLGL
jgi:exopolyphosphatase/guanosine-5'-triphosphate,3'-diphosphate pyrophosphatase